jgi:hypothetical protein
MATTRTRSAGRSWARDEIIALGTRIDGITACEIVYGFRPTRAYQALASGEVEFRTIRAGRRWWVPTTEVLRLLGLDDDPVPVR